MEFLANLLANLGGAVAETGSSACLFMMLDEPECPESLIK
ncbi:MAG: AgrD family cyclic lactone autoinducer peptide [Bacilli bacterium]